MRSWWWLAPVLLAAGTAALTMLGKVPSLPGWMATGIALIAGLATATMSDVVRAHLRWRVERRPTAAAALRNGFLLTPRGRMPRVVDVEAVALGVHRAMRVAEGKTAELPPYVRRDLDLELDELLPLGGLVVIEGKSAAGKTRTAIEAMRRTLAGRSLLIPRDGAALRALIESGTHLRKAVVWLDDLERFFVSGGLDAQLVTRVCPPGRSDVVLLATMRSQVLHDMVSTKSAAEAEFARKAADVLAIATTRLLDRQLSASELQRAEALRGDARIADALDHVDEVGLAEYLCAGPAILARWQSGRDADGVALVGAALISAAVDCRRAGCASPLPRAVLAELYPHYLDPRDAHRPGRPSVDDGLIWATKPVRGASSCLVSRVGDRYLAFGYLVNLPERVPDAKPVPESVWTALLAHLDPRELNLVGLAALKAGQEDIGRQILVRWAESTDDPATWCLVGTLLLWDGSAAKWDQRSAEAEPWLVRAAEAGHPDAARHLMTLFGAHSDAAAAERWARHGAAAGDAYAMTYLGEMLEERGHLTEAKQWYRQAAESEPIEAKRSPLEAGHLSVDLPPMSVQLGRVAGDYVEFECAPLTAMALRGVGKTRAARYKRLSLTRSAGFPWSGSVGAAGWGEDPGDLGDGLGAWAGVAHGGTRVLVAGLGHDELERDLRFAEVGGGGVAELVEVEPGVLLEQDAGAIVAEAGAAGVRADVLGAGSAGGSWFAVGQEQWSAGADGAVGVAVGEAQQPG